LFAAPFRDRAEYGTPSTVASASQAHGDCEVREPSSGRHVTSIGLGAWLVTMVARCSSEVATHTTLVSLRPLRQLKFWHLKRQRRQMKPRHQTDAAEPIAEMPAEAPLGIVAAPEDDFFGYVIPVVWFSRDRRG
jgi:hypothetical protein